MPSRDTSGKCEGECKNQVSELEKKQQEKIDKMDSSTSEKPPINYSQSDDKAPGSLGGHV